MVLLVPCALGLVAKGWHEAERLAADADTERLRRLSPAAGIAEFLRLVALARALAPPPFHDGEAESQHVRALIATAAAFRRGARR